MARFGLEMRKGEDSMFVSGVKLMLGAPLEVDMLWCCGGALKTDDTVLVCEEADPTPLRISPGTNSLSSAVEGGIFSALGVLGPLVNRA